MINLKIARSFIAIVVSSDMMTTPSIHRCPLRTRDDFLILPLQIEITSRTCMKKLVSNGRMKLDECYTQRASTLSPEPGSIVKWDTKQLFSRIGPGELVECVECAEFFLLEQFEPSSWSEGMLSFLLCLTFAGSRDLRVRQPKLGMQCITKFPVGNLPKL